MSRRSTQTVAEPPPTTITQSPVSADAGATDNANTATVALDDAQPAAPIVEIPVANDGQPPYFRVRKAEVVLTQRLLAAIEADPSVEFLITVTRK